MNLRDEKAQTPMGDESTILERVARIISSVRGAKPDYAHLAAELEPVLPFDVFGIVLLRHDGSALRVAVCQREGDTWVARYRQHPLLDSMMERLLRAASSAQKMDKTEQSLEGADAVVGQSAGLVVENFPEGATGLPAECGDALCAFPRVRAALIAPLFVGAKMLGTLELGSMHLHAYADPALQRLSNALASLLATAIDSAVAGGNVEIQDRQREELKNVSTALTAAVDLPMILQRIVLGITNALHVSSAIIRFDQSRGYLHLEAHSGLHFDPHVLDQVLLRLTNALSEQTIIGATLLHRQRQVTQDLAQDERFPQSKLLASTLSIRSLVCYPLISGQYVYGVLLLLSSEPGGFTPLKIDICALFAGQATVAIHNEMLLQSAQERRHFQELIERLEHVQQEHLFKQDGYHEIELWQRLHTQTMHTFGVSLGSILHFISEHLLTRSECQLPEILRTAQARREKARLRGKNANYGTEMEADTASLLHPELSSGMIGASFLRQSAQTALATTTLLSDISPALMRALHVDDGHPQAYEQFKRDLAEPWLVVDATGQCIYLNRAAEAFCNIQVEQDRASVLQRWSEEHASLFGSFHALPMCKEGSFTLEQVLAPLLPRMRQRQEILGYLRDFATVPGEHALPMLPMYIHCIIAAEAITERGTLMANAREPVSVSLGAKIPDPHFITSLPKYTRTNSLSDMLLDSAPSDRYYQLIRHTLYNGSGQCFAYALHIHDITEQVRDEKNKAVLLASVSHDLRTPLTSIKAAVTGLLQADLIWDEDTRREMLEDIDAEADHLTTLVNSLVAMSQIEMGALVLEKEWCDVPEVVHIALLRCQNLLADFTVVSKIDDDVPMVYADYVQLERVLRNLLENVTRYSPKHSEIRVFVDIPGQSVPGLSEEQAQGVRVQIIDQGPGIPPEERERIFKSFYSLTPQGSGLGLAICRGIVEAHQGRIWVEEAASGGACFVFVLPLAL